ncbi:MAG: hypothetical protein ACXAB9_10715 [Candidatus Thorarchaeota archaeon]|jgi:hypothetical protein
MSTRQSIIDEIIKERDGQPPFDDSENRQGLWSAYIGNYATRWTMPFTFNTDKYTFRTCMIKAAALALAAIEWWDDCVVAPVVKND